MLGEQVKFKLGTKLKVIEANYDLTVGQIVEVIDSGEYSSHKDFWTNGSTCYPYGLCFNDNQAGQFEVLEDALPTQTTPGEAEMREVEEIYNFLQDYRERNDKPMWQLIIQVLVSNGTLTLQQVKRTLGEG